MQRILAILLAVLLPLLLVVSAAYALYRPGLPAEAQDVLDAFVAFERRSQPATVVAGFHAAPWPEQLNARTAGTTFSTDRYYCTTFGADFSTLSTTAVTTGRSDLQVSPVEAAGCNVRAVPYPARAAWCVTLSDEGAVQAGLESGTAAVIVARHDDMYVARWIVHIPADEAAACAVCGCPVR